MANASDYPINFPYGATSPPYSVAHPHRGDDRACPEGTPLVVAGQQIGLTGKTGYVIGAHLHIQEWRGDYSNTRKPQNSFKPGVVKNIDPAGTQGDGSFGKFITIQTSDGWNDTYCHLSRIDVKVGQEIGMSKDALTEAELKEVHYGYLMAWPGPLFLQAYTGQPLIKVIEVLRSSANPLRAAVEKQYEAGAKVPELEKQVKSLLMDNDTLTRIHRLAMGVEPGPDYLKAFTGGPLQPVLKQLEGDPNRLNNKPGNVVPKTLPPGLYEVK